MAQRSFGATTFEEEKQRLLGLVADLVWGSNCQVDPARRLAEGYPLSSEELRGDREAAIAVARCSPHLLKHSSEALRGDFQVISTALKHAMAGHEAFVHFSEVMKSDPRAIGLALEAARRWDDGPTGLRRLIEAIPSVFKTDQDKALSVYRETLNDKNAKRWYDQVDQKLKSAISFERFDQASCSALATAGEEGAPILSVRLSHRSNEAVGSGRSFCCEATLLSGTTIMCQIDRWGTERPGPILNDLATKLLEELPKDNQGEAAAQHIFIFFPNGDGDHVKVSVWDFDRPLSDFLFADES